jgi:hypothetical protein
MIDRTNEQDLSEQPIHGTYDDDLHMVVLWTDQSDQWIAASDEITVDPTTKR